ncbi:hypothetical protein SprV_0100272600 [Sparganum proliferum]
MFNHLQRRLPEDYAEELCDLLIYRSLELPYDKLKEVLVKRVAMVEERRLRQLLTVEEFGDRKPSQLLRTVQQFVGERKFETSILRQLFLQCLPLDVQTVLTISQGSIEELAELADKVMALRVLETSAVSHAASPISQEYDQGIDRLEELVMQLTNQLSAVTAGGPRRSRDPVFKWNVLVSPEIWRSSTTMSAAMFIEATSQGLGKLYRPAVEANAGGSVANRHTRYLFLWDRIADAESPVDSGFEVKVVPPSPAERKNRSSFCLMAANNSSIPTSGRRSITLDLGLLRIFRRVFIIADVSVAFIGVDFLAHFNLLVDLRNRRLVDCITNLHARCQSGVTPCDNTLTVMPISDCPFHSLLRQFPRLTNPSFREVDIKHTVTHHISTTVSLKSCRPRRLAPDSLKISTAEFEHMPELGIIRQSDSCWASSLHLVPKRRGDW